MSIEKNTKTSVDNLKSKYNTGVNISKPINDNKSKEDIFNENYGNQIIALVRDLRIIMYIGVSLVVLVTLLDGIDTIPFNIDPAPHVALISGVAASGTLKTIFSSYFSKN